MTALDRFDPFERRITDAIDEIAATHPLDYLDDILRQTARLAQRPRWTFLGRWLPVERTFDQPRAVSVGLLLLVAVLIALVGGALWAASQPPSLEGPLAEFPGGEWEAPNDGLSFGLPSGATKETLLIDSTAGLRSLRVTEQGFVVGTAAFVSSIVKVSGTEVDLTITSVTPLGGGGSGQPGTPVAVDGNLLGACDLGDVGRYRWSLSSGGSALTLQSLGDACPSREAVLARRWTLVFRGASEASGSLPEPATTALLRPDGQVLIFGGRATARAGLGSLGAVPEAILLYEPASGVSVEIGSTAASVSFAIPLADGRVLAIELEAPGPGPGSGGGSSAELIDPDARQVVPLGPTLGRHLVGAGVRLADGRVLLVGEAAGTTEAELFDPTTGTFTATGSTSRPMMQPTATLLADGRVLVVGEREPIAELYDPATGTFTPTGTMAEPHEDFSATFLQDGRVMIVGGWATNGTVVDGVFIPSEPARLGTFGEIYDPAIGRFSQVGPMVTPRVYHFAVALTDGRVLIGGGTSSTRADVGSGGIVDPIALDAELFDPISGVFSRTGALGMPRFGAGAVLLRDGRVLVIGSVQPLGSGSATDLAAGSSLEMFE